MIRRASRARRALALGLALAGAVPTAVRADAPAATEEETPARVGVVNLNTASAGELVRLPGVGPARARAILDLRARLGGRFRRVEALLRVKGIGRATFRRIRPHLVLDGPTTLDEGR